MFEKLKTVESRYETLMGRISDAAVQADPAEYRKHTKALAELQPLVDKVREHQSLEREIGETRELVEADDDELRKLAEAGAARARGAPGRCIGGGQDSAPSARSER